MTPTLHDALGHHRDGRLEQAEALYRAHLQQRPDDPDVLNFLGTLLGQLERFDEGEQLLRRALELVPDHAPVWNNLGGVLRAAGRAEEAETAYRRSLELEPRDPETWANLGMALIDRGRPAEASAMFLEAVARRRAPGPPPLIIEQGPETCVHRLQHDLAQLEHLQEGGVRVPDLDEHIASLREVVREVGDREGSFRLSAEQYRRIARSHGRLIHHQPPSALDGPAVNPALDTAAITDDYRTNGPGYTHFDGLLTDQALAALRRFCLESSLWFKEYPRGYLGAMMRDGFACPLLMQIGEELREALPEIFGDHSLREWWAFKYDSELDGIPMHADHAAVNVNFWITPDDAMTDPDAGGLTVWDVEAPLDWDFRRYNSDEAAMRAFVEEQGARAIYVPHRQNRVVMFNSDLFHATGPIRFGPAYDQRRINVTFLYGDRRQA